VSDEVFEFHCQQAAEKLLKALLSELGVRFRKTHELGALAAMLTGAGYALPQGCTDLDEFTPFGAVYRYEDYDAALGLDRRRAREMLRLLREWVETGIRERALLDG
jgi:HEPN domain-containing protein